MPPAIRIENLGKRYRVNHAVERPDYRTLRESLVSVAAAPWRRIRSGGQDGAVEDFWALKDVSFDVQPGEVVGIIGRNGAGKSTLLKILSRITKPTTGRVTLRGRVGSLLEVGTGFHPELTGRENVYLNGGILGMSRKEIDRNFDAIVDFSGVEKFLDTPVKRYSSGMQVRLAFAVAAHLDPEILIVDEVLAVGDAEFQKKCLGKMREVSTSGRTVFFVSHNMTAIQSLCTRAIALHGGVIHQDGPAKPVVSQYVQSVLCAARSSPLAIRKDRTGSGQIQLTHVGFESVEGYPIHSVRSGADTVISLDYVAPTLPATARVDVGISFSTPDEQLLTVLYSSYVGQTFSKVPDAGRFRCRIRKLPLAPGTYGVGARVLVNGLEADWPRDGVGEITVEPGDFYGSGHKGFEHFAPLLLSGNWTVTA